MSNHAERTHRREGRYLFFLVVGIALAIIGIAVLSAFLNHGGTP